MAIQQAWVDFIQDSLLPLKSPGFLVFLLRGLVWEIDQKVKTAELVLCAKPAYQKFDHTTTNEVLEHLGYTLTESPDAVKEKPEQFIQALWEIKEGKIGIVDSIVFQRIQEAWIKMGGTNGR